MKQKILGPKTEQQIGNGENLNQKKNMPLEDIPKKPDDTYPGKASFQALTRQKKRHRRVQTTRRKHEREREK